MSNNCKKVVKVLEIKYFNRPKGQMEVEKVYGDKAVKLLYENPLGKLFSGILSTAPIRILYGALQDASFSKRKIAPFVKSFDISMNDFLPEEGRTVEDPYSSFNKFFIRRFKEGMRSFDQALNEMPAFSEARYFGYSSINEDQKIPVKGKFLSPAGLLANKKWEETFSDGPLLLARLCPVDYHRFHYPDKGKVIDHYQLHGKLHSVSPIALRSKEDILISNERQVTILETENFGKIAYIEVGAMCVGKIVQSSSLESFERGEEKGYFLFGGSTVIIVGEKGKWIPSQDILEHTSNGVESYIQLGNTVANKL